MNFFLARLMPAPGHRRYTIFSAISVYLADAFCQYGADDPQPSSASDEGGQRHRRSDPSRTVLTAPNMSIF
jgi:hypothetical protein